MVVTFEGHRRLSARFKVNTILETQTMAGRVVIGYDDSRSVVILHDPTFGPAFEMSYADFDSAWSAAGNSWAIVHPRMVGPRTFPADTSTYRARTVDEQATEHFVHGYALFSLGRFEEAEKRFRRGLLLDGLDSAHHFLLLTELALVLNDEKRYDESVAAAEEAVRLMPDHELPWSCLRSAYPLSHVPEAQKKSEEAGERLKKLQKDKRARGRVLEALPCDFWVMYLDSDRGWCRR
jgi:tetratricopeptide (TPR) repeat protein